MMPDFAQMLPPPSDAYSFTYQHAMADYRDTWRIFRIMAEFIDGYQFLSSFKKSVTVLGSARLKNSNSTWYKEARTLGGMLAKQGYVAITGGGPGIMEAANRGATENGGESVGLNIQLPFEQRVNKFVKKSTAFYYFFTRKVMLTAPSHAFVFFPGGFGTLDELFEVYDNMHLGKMPHAPIILVGKTFWTPLLTFIKTYSMKMVGAIDDKTFRLLQVVDSAHDAMAIINKLRSKKPICDLSHNMFDCGTNINWRIFRIMSELVDGFEFLTRVKNDVTVLGSRSVSPKSRYYEAAYQLGRRLIETKHMVISGGAGGVMEAVSKGAKDAGGDPIGITLKFDGKERINPYVQRTVGFEFPFTRKVILTAPSKLFVFFPGGLGTFHELFEILTLQQNNKMGRIPVLLFDSAYWGPLVEFFKHTLVHELRTINPADLDLFQIVDSVEDVMRVAKKRAV